MAIHPNLLYNGEVLDASAKVLSPGQTGVLTGWGVFSTLSVRQGVLFAWERHYARMRHDAELMRIPFPEDSEALRRDLLRLVEANKAWDGTLRVSVMRNHGGQFEGPSVTRDFDVIAFTKDAAVWDRPCRLNVTPEGRHSGGPFASAKILSWSLNLTMLEAAQRQGFDETILLDSRGFVAECTSANIFAIQGNEVVTPPRVTGCLPGVTRSILLEEVAIEGVRIYEKDLTVKDLTSADGVFVTSSTRDTLAVAEIEGNPVRQDTKVLPLIREEFKKYVGNYISKHKIPHQ